MRKAVARANRTGRSRAPAIDGRTRPVVPGSPSRAIVSESSDDAAATGTRTLAPASPAAPVPAIRRGPAARVGRVGRRPRRTTRSVWTIVVASAVVGALAADAAPTGWPLADATYRALAAGLVALAGSRARRWTWFVLGGVSGLVASGWWALAGVASIAVGLLGSWRRRRSRPIGAAVGALAVQGLLHQSWYGFQGASMVVGALAVAPLLVSAHRRCRHRQRRVNLIVAGDRGAASFVSAHAVVRRRGAQGRAAIQDGADQARDRPRQRPGEETRPTRSRCSLRRPNPSSVAGRTSMPGGRSRPAPCRWWPRTPRRSVTCSTTASRS